MHTGHIEGGEFPLAQRGGLFPVCSDGQPTTIVSSDANEKGWSSVASDRFDSLIRRLSETRPRRGALGLLLGSSIGLLGLTETEARKKKGKHKKKHRDPVPTCSDGLKNGSETDIDCGGTCGPCENGKTCASLTDCQSGRCAPGGICQTCSGDGAGNCPVDGAGQCQCSPQGACYSNSASIAPDCESCPEGTAACIFFDADLGANCYLRCGVA